MELSVDEKIKSAIDPLLERILALENDNQRFKEEIASLQSQLISKPTHKPATKPLLDHAQRPQTAKGARKQPQHHEVKPDAKAHQRAGQKKEDVKVQQEEAKIQGNKPVVTRSGINNGKVLGTPTSNKDVHDPKNIKAKPTTSTGSSRPSLPINNNKAVLDKKLPHKNNETQPEKKQDGQEEKKHTSQQKEHKPSTTHGVKSPAVNKPKPAQKPADKKPLVPPSPATTIKKQPPLPKAEQRQKKRGKPQLNTQAEAKVEEEKNEIQVSIENQETSAVKEESVSVNQPKVEAAQIVAEQPKVQEKEQAKVENQVPSVQVSQTPSVQVSEVPSAEVSQVPTVEVQRKQEVAVQQEAL